MKKKSDKKLTEHPSIGRIVLYLSVVGDVQFPAIITAVYENDEIDLVYFDPIGVQPCMGVEGVAFGPPTGGNSWQWPPRI